MNPDQTTSKNAVLILVNIVCNKGHQTYFVVEANNMNPDQCASKKAV